MQRLHYQSLIVIFKYTIRNSFFFILRQRGEICTPAQLPQLPQLPKHQPIIEGTRCYPPGGLYYSSVKRGATATERRHSHREAPQPQRGATATERRHSHSHRQQTNRAKTCAFCARCQIKVSLCQAKKQLISYTQCVSTAMLKIMSYYDNACHNITV